MTTDDKKIDDKKIELEGLEALGAILDKLEFTNPRQKYFLLGADKPQQVRFSFMMRLPHERWDHASATVIKERKKAPVLVLLPGWEKNRFSTLLVGIVQQKGGAVIAGRLFHALWQAHGPNVGPQGSALPKIQPPRDK